MPLIEELRALDPQFRVFGAETHGYRFNPPLSESAVAAFEAQQGVHLPADYREFITQIGDGGAGPHYGMEKLAIAAKDSALTSPFPWSAETTITTEDDIDLWDRPPGVLMLSQRGCGYYDILVVTGAQRGHMWSDFSAGSGALVFSHESFMVWYVEWAERCIATIKREPLIDQIRIGMTVDEVRAVLGHDMQQWDGVANLPGAPAYHIGFTNTNATFGMGPDHRVVHIFHCSIA